MGGHRFEQRKGGKVLACECVYNAADNYGSANVAETKTSGKLTVATEHGITYQSHFLNDDHNLQAQALMQLTTTTSHSQYVKKQGLPSSDITDATATGYISGTENGNSNDKTLGGWDACTTASRDVTSLMPIYVWTDPRNSAPPTGYRSRVYPGFLWKCKNETEPL